MRERASRRNERGPTNASPRDQGPRDRPIDGAARDIKEGLEARAHMPPPPPPVAVKRGIPASLPRSTNRRPLRACSRKPARPDVKWESRTRSARSTARSGEQEAAIDAASRLRITRRRTQVKNTTASSMKKAMARSRGRRRDVEEKEANALANEGPTRPRVGSHPQRRARGAEAVEDSPRKTSTTATKRHAAIRPPPRARYQRDSPLRAPNAPGYRAGRRALRNAIRDQRLNGVALELPRSDIPFADDDCSSPSASRARSLAASVISTRCGRGFRWRVDGCRF